MCKKAVDNYSHVLEFVPECYKAQKICDKAVDTYSFRIKFVPECFSTKEMCHKAASRCTAWQVAKYRVFSDPYFTVFKLNMEICSVNIGNYGYRKYRKFWIWEIMDQKKLRIRTLLSQWCFFLFYSIPDRHKLKKCVTELFLKILF